MNTYLVTMHESSPCQWHEFVVLAWSEESAIALLRTQHPPGGDFPEVNWDGGYEIRRVDDYGSEVIVMEHLMPGDPGRAEVAALFGG
jgi:hypothetical protein